MVVEEFVNFFDWIGPAFFWFFVVLCVCVVVGTIYGFVVSAVRNGPGEAFYSIAMVIAQAIPDLMKTSPRRIYALAKLAVQESIRKRTLLVTFVIFAAALLIGGWFLDVRSDKPNEIYLSFVLFGTQLLILISGVMISCFSIPQDLKVRTIYTVVTKPVRAFEIVSGRILGFAFMGTLLLMAMGVISYLFVLAGLRHSHDIELSSFEEVDQQTGLTSAGRRASINAVLEGATTFNSHHRHRVEVIELEKENENDPFQFAMVVMPTSAHTHERVIVDGDRPDYLSEDGIFTFDRYDDYKQILDLFSEPNVDDRIRIRTGGEEGYLQSRVPMYAESLRFIDRSGNATNKGVSVGDEWEYRSYIDGGTSQARAYFKFTGIDKNRFEGDSLPLELTLGVFRTHKGDIEKRVTGTINLRKEKDGVIYQSSDRIFESEEFSVQTIDINRELDVSWIDKENGTSQSATMDLFDEFAEDGEFEIWLRCNEGGQFFGVARGDVYFRARETPFWWNFFKCYAGIWLQMIVVVTMGVSFSTFVNGPVSLLGCISTVIVMSRVGFIHDLATAQLEGGGPLEATWRLFTQQNLTNELEAGVALTVVQSIDWVLLQVMDILASAVPDMAKINTMDNLAYGYNINIHALGTHVVMCLGFCFVAAMIGYFRMRTREIAAS